MILKVQYLYDKIFLIFFRINVTDILEFFPSEDVNRVRFIWASEETGWRHLYLITAQLHLATQDMALEDFSECKSFMP